MGDNLPLQSLFFIATITTICLSFYSFFVREQVMTAIFWAILAVAFALLFDGLNEQ